jgi:thiol:disulfide interchange protein/DsbC/DsbD-like thiol-disulfide interchange protein
LSFRSVRVLTLLLSLFALLASAASQADDIVRTPRVAARLVAASSGVPASGGTIALGLQQHMQPGWHTYWINPGESGEPTKIVWTVPPGFAVSDIFWPHPERIPFGELANYGYSNDVLLRVDVTVPPGLKVGDKVTFKGEVSWLVCKDICIPEKGSLDLTLPVVDEAARFGPNDVAEDIRAAFDDARRREPVKSNSFDARFAANDAGVTLYFFPTLNRIERGVGALFFPYEKGLIKASAPQTSEQREGGFAIVVPPGWKMRDAEKRKAIDAIDGVLVLAPQGGNPSQSFVVSLKRGDVPPPKLSAAAADLPLLQAVLFAVLGGLILNLMPCVFPILSMKALSLVKAGHTEQPWLDGVAYLLGVMTTFTVLAGVLLWLRATGEDAGWGFQLQSPLSVAILAYVLALVGFNLSGLFELGGSVQGTGQGLASQGGLIGAFFTGVLAVVVAAPCTAPFMGAAMGFAFTQSPAITIVIFLALGFGLALPWVVFSFSPALIRLMPRPGPWMERFKQFLAFPMYAAAAWLVWVVSQQITPEGLFRVMIGLVFLALAAWAFGVVQAQAAQSRPRFLSSILFLLGVAAAAAALAVPFTGRESSTELPEASGLPAEPYTGARLAELRGRGQPVFVNLTAAWCVSCLYNERVALSTAAVAEAFKATNTVYLVGDWTNQNPEVSALLKEHGREGVPLYLYFPPGGAEPRVLPQLLTELLIMETLGMTK